ncbi:hypothetical protein LJC06_04795 [Bacteroidales bacterium OttesenSCG-928-I14]|nr:hypothetical protein [Bacteroidales bacterium OttesenSCG-928-I14]
MGRFRQTTGLAQFSPRQAKRRVLKKYLLLKLPPLQAL